MFDDAFQAHSRSTSGAFTNTIKNHGRQNSSNFSVKDDLKAKKEQNTSQK